MNNTENAVSTLDSVIVSLTTICGDSYVITDPEKLSDYGKDNTLDLHFPFDILIKPGTSEEIAQVMKLCNRHRIPVTPRGAGSGVTGGALPVNGGIVLSLERLNKIVGINTVDGYVTAESGVITADLCACVKEHGWYFPVEPSSASFSFVGGNVAENAGSINSCRYGTTERYVLNLEVVLPSGEIIWTGANVMKNATGFNLTQLLVGSEGTLGIITKVVYRLLPKPAHEVSLLAAFERLEDACNAIIAIKRVGVSPSAVELICSNALEIAAAYLKTPQAANIKAQLLINLQEADDTTLTGSMEKMAGLLENFTKETILVATNAKEKEQLWKLRYSIGTALTAEKKKYRDLDLAVPLSFLYQYITRVEAICEAYNIPVACFGHALDGNLHTMVQLHEDADAAEQERTDKAVHEIYAYAIANGGVISGEHGIGLLQKPFMAMQFSKAHLTLMRGIKQLFDPHGILNPGKVL